MGSSSNPYWKDEIERYQRENEELREVLRRCGELAGSRKTGAIQSLVLGTLGTEHFSSHEKWRNRLFPQEFRNGEIILFKGKVYERIRGFVWYVTTANPNLGSLIKDADMRKKAGYRFADVKKGGYVK